MKGVRCSWVDMQAIRQALANGERGDQARLEHMRCVDHSTIATWKAACDVMEAIEGKCDLSHISSFQPTHAREIARAFRKTHGKEWTEEVKEQVAEWVDRCEAERLTVADLRQALLAEVVVNGHAPESARDYCTVLDLEKLEGRTFSTIYADPPWQYGNQATRASTDDHYQTLTVDEIAALPVAALVAPNAHLHLWTTNGFLFESRRVLEAWGFEYKSCFVWCKPQFGLGNYWRVAHEFLLLGVRGSLPFRDQSLRSWGEYDRDRHSSKPEQVRLLIEKASPGPYLELFGRLPVLGWTVWGNQIERNLFHG